MVYSANGFDVEELVARQLLSHSKKVAKLAMTVFVKYVPNKPGHFHIHRSKTWIEYMSKFYTIDVIGSGAHVCWRRWNTESYCWC